MDARRKLVEAGLLALAAAAWTAVAWRIHPVWDDGWLWLQGLEGAATIRASMADRPLLGAIWAGLAESGLLLPVSAAAHLAGWLGLALVTRAWWRRLFPRQAALGLVAAILPLSTVLLELQHVLVNPVWGGLLGVVLVWGAALWLTAGGPGGEAPSPLRAAGAALAVAAACLLSEYGVVAAGVAAVLLLVLGGARPARRAGWRPALVVAGAAAAGYALLLATSDPALRPDARPDTLLDLGATRLLATPFVVATELWQGMVGNLLRRAGALEGESRESLAALAASALAAALVAWVARDRGGRPEASEPASPSPSGPRSTDGPSVPGAIPALLAASAAGLLVMALAARVPWSGPSSRFYLPVAPLLACLAVWLPLRLGASRRAVALAITFVAVFGAVRDVDAVAAERRRIADLAPLVARHLDRGGFTLVVLVAPEANGVSRRAYGHELTARMARELPPPLRSRFWAVRADALGDEGVTGVELPAAIAAEPRLERRLRGLGAPKEISRVLWLVMEGGRGAVRAVVSEPGGRRQEEAGGPLRYGSLAGTAGPSGPSPARPLSNR